MTEANKHQYNLIQQYLNGTLDPGRMHELEKEALEDPFLAEALEGYAEFDGLVQPHLSLLQRQLEERISEAAEKKNMFFFTWQRLSVAAAAGLLFVSASILFWMKGTNNDSQLAGDPKKVEVSLTPGERIGLDEQREAPSVVAKTAPLTESQLPVAQQPDRAQGTDKKATVSSRIRPAKNQTLAGRINPAPARIIPTQIDSSMLAPKAHPAENTLASLSYSPGSTGTVISPQVPESAPATVRAFKTTRLAVTAADELASSAVLPTEGWKSFKAYVQAEKRLPAPGGEVSAVTLIFTIDSVGKPNSFKIEQGISAEYDAEAVRLLKEGPLWKAGQIGGNQIGRVTIDFKN